MGVSNPPCIDCRSIECIHIVPSSRPKWWCLFSASSAAFPILSIRLGFGMPMSLGDGVTHSQVCSGDEIRMEGLVLVSRLQGLSGLHDI